MSTVIKDSHLNEVTVISAPNSAFNGFVKEEPTIPSNSCIKLQSEDSSVVPNKRKHSEMVRYDKLEKIEESPFNIPTPRDQFGMSGPG
mmetsp:Transcript_12464/g.14013  ORF Transcript_12464/g.14013 Transcript_12464/m.14013 type:complete len:88 (+) Transcript_12464:155-418(+)